jgi:hypothetical protein
MHKVNVSLSSISHSSCTFNISFYFCGDISLRKRISSRLHHDKSQQAYQPNDIPPHMTQYAQAQQQQFQLQQQQQFQQQFQQQQQQQQQAQPVYSISQQNLYNSQQNLYNSPQLAPTTQIPQYTNQAQANMYAQQSPQRVGMLQSPQRVGMFQSPRSISMYGMAPLQMQESIYLPSSRISPLLSLFLVFLD